MATSRETRFGLLLDARGARGLSGAQRRMTLMHMKRTAPLSARLLVQAIVQDNAILRTLDNTIELIFGRPFPSRSFSEPESAHAWLLEQLGASVTPTPTPPAP